MTKRFAALKKLAGVAAMAIVITGAGLGLGSGVAQASPTKTTPDIPHPVLNRNFENSRLDRFLDRFFNDDHKMAR